MTLDPRSTLALFKANLELQFRLCDLLRRNALRWSEAQNRMLDSCASELESVATRMLDAPDWQQLGFVASDLGWKAMQQQNCASLRMAELSIANQSALMQDIQSAYAKWQASCAAALRESAGAMPVSAALEESMQAAMALLAAPGGVRSGKPNCG
ncbi:MAG: hypothetical protein ACYC5W_11985 [Thauera sp.]